MKIVHISLTSASGAPGLIMKALHKFTSIQSRWILLLYQNHSSEHDIIYKEENKDFCIELIKEADVLHFHHPINFSSVDNPFGLDLTKIARKSCKFVFSFHISLLSYYPTYPVSDSINYLISYITNNTKQNIKYTALPQHGRYYPFANICPNIVDIDSDIDNNYKITDLPLVAFTPSNTKEAFSTRWDTKSSNKVLEVLKKLENMGKIKFVFLNNVHLDEVIALKKKANIVIDDLSTGALHISALEGVMLGKATITFLDNPTLSALSETLGTAEFPFINITFENLEEVLLKLCNDYSLIEQIGSYSREWGKNYYSPANIVKKFVAIYQSKSTNGKIKIKQTSKRLDTKEIYFKARQFLQIEVPDIIYWQRAKMDKLISAIKTFI